MFSSAVVNSSKAVAAFEKQHLLISPFAIEGLHQIGNSFANLRLYDSLNVKYATLTHNCHNKFADAALITDGDGQTIKAPPLWGGVSKDGQVVVREMNRLGMLVDLSHVSENTMLDVLGGRKEKWEGSAAPVIFSHSSAYALCPHPRNVVSFLEAAVHLPAAIATRTNADSNSALAGRSSRPCQKDKFSSHGQCCS